MKTNEMGTGALIDKESLNELFNETKETLAVTLKPGRSNRTFGAVDMWNVQKKQRTATAMLRRWSN